MLKVHGNLLQEASSGQIWDIDLRKQSESSILHSVDFMLL